MFRTASVFTCNRNKARRLVYQNVLPQFFWVRSIFFGEIVISLMMLMTGRALATHSTERNVAKIPTHTEKYTYIENNITDSLTL